MIRKKDYDWSLYERIPEATKGEFCIKKRTIPKGSTVKLYNPGGWFYHDKTNANLPTTRLEQSDDTLWMTDAPAEQDQAAMATSLAHGHVLMLGLGLGYFVMDVKRRNQLVKSITIVEQSRDVALLVYPYIRNTKTRLITDEAEHYLNAAASIGIEFDFIYIDIWAGYAQPIEESQKWVDLAKSCLKESGTTRYWMQELHDRVRSKLPTEPVSTVKIAYGDPCLICGKGLRLDYAGLCADCADTLGVSDMFIQT